MAIGVIAGHPGVVPVDNRVRQGEAGVVDGDAVLVSPGGGVAHRGGPIHDPAIPVPLFRNLVLRNTSVVDIPPDEPAPSEMNDTSVTVADPDAGVSSVSMNPIPVPTSGRSHSTVGR